MRFFFFFFSFFLPCLFIPGTYQIRSYRVTVFVNDSMVIKTGANSNLSYLTHDQGLGVEFWCRRTVRAHVFHWFREGGRCACACRPLDTDLRSPGDPSAEATTS